MTLTDQQRKALEAPLDARRVSQRSGGGGKSLSYLQSHDVKRTANRIFGYDGWSYTVDELVCLGEEPFKRNGKDGFRVGYRATVTVIVGETRRGDTGYGDAIEYNGSRITPHELASKEAVSDATKRCLASWGDQFGLVLYGDDPVRSAPAEIEPTRAPRKSKQPTATAEELQYVRDLAKQAGCEERVEKAIASQEHGATAAWAAKASETLLRQLADGVPA